jgi:hypothetical protein
MNLGGWAATLDVLDRSTWDIAPYDIAGAHMIDLTTMGTLLQVPPS